MNLSVTETEKWDEVINSIDQDMIPIDCVKKVVFKLRGGKQRTINLNRLRKQGLLIEDIEVVVNRNIGDFGKDIVNLMFVIDVAAVAEQIQPLTRKYLANL
jgi:hypothetical protein